MSLPPPALGASPDVSPPSPLLLISIRAATFLRGRRSPVKCRAAGVINDAIIRLQALPLIHSLSPYSQHWLLDYSFTGLEPSLGIEIP